MPNPLSLSLSRVPRHHFSLFSSLLHELSNPSSLSLSKKRGSMAAISRSEPVRRSSHPEGHKQIEDEQHRLPATIDRMPPQRNRSRSCFTTSTLWFLFFIFIFVFVTTIIFNSWQIGLFHSPGPGTDTVSGLASNGQAPKKRHVGSVLRFLPADLVRRFSNGGLDRLRTSPRLGVRPPRLALVSSSLIFS